MLSQERSVTEAADLQRNTKKSTTHSAAPKSNKKTEHEREEVMSSSTSQIHPCLNIFHQFGSHESLKWEENNVQHREHEILSQPPEDGNGKNGRPPTRAIQIKIQQCFWLVVHRADERGGSGVKLPRGPVLWQGPENV